MKVLPLLLLVTASCYGGREARFFDKPVVTASDDRHPIPKPTERPFYNLSYAADATVFQPMIDALDRPPQHRAGDTNAVDEVPDSTWFDNRIGIRPVTPAEAAQGPDVDGPPVAPYKLSHLKTEGNPGFLMKDSRGKKYLVKFDTAENPEQQTGSNVVVNRIFWTLGYHVPADYVFAFDPKELKIPLDAQAEGADQAAVDRILAPATHLRDGRIRATASQFLDGIPCGGWSSTGTREDDANDHVNHEDRRTVRALRVFSAWLGHTDMKEANSLDMYVGEPGQGHLEHYLVDFGEALGGHQSEKQKPSVGWEYAWDWSYQSRALFALGFWKRPWEGQKETPYPAVGMFGADKFDPRDWKSFYRYEPFLRTDRTDAYWAAKLVMKFDKPMIQAIVAAGKFSDPGASTYLVDTLIARRDKIGNAYMDGVTPLDDVTIADSRLCGVDLARMYGLRREGDLVANGRVLPIANDGRTCVLLPPGEGYQVMKIQIRRERYTTPPMYVHYIRGTTPHLLGIVR